jgi:predicted transcriptional regulator
MVEKEEFKFEIDQNQVIKSVSQLTERFVDEMERYGVYIQAIVTAHENTDGKYRISTWFRNSKKSISMEIEEALENVISKRNGD